MKAKILKELETDWAGRTCFCYEVLESTNDLAKELSKQGPVHGTLIVSDTQSAGKGRRGRCWESQKGESISMSLCLEPKMLPEKMSGITLAAALAVAHAIEETARVKTQIKWPNDLVVCGRKVCGILTEMHFVKEHFAVVVGIGVNVNQEEFPEEIREIAGSLKMVTGKTISRETLICAILKHFEEIYAQYETAGDLASVKEDYEKMLANKDREVLVLDPAASFRGIARGITAQGGLVVDRLDGQTIEVCSGEVSVRGLLGYV